MSKQKSEMAVAQAQPQNQAASLRELVQSEGIKARMASMLPKHVSADRMIRVCVGAMNRSPKLAKCTQASFLECLMKLSQWGLEPDGQRAHLIPYGDKCTLVIDYKGVAELVLRSGMVSSLHAELVCENDEFVYDRGQVVKHVVNWKQPRGDVYAVWCRIVFTTGGEKHEVMTVDEINAIRDKSQGYQAAQKYDKKDNPWQLYWGEMAKKTVFKRAAKWAPWSAEIRDAIDHDDDDYRTVAGAVTSVQTVAIDDVAALIAQPAPPEWDSTAFLAELKAATTAEQIDAVEAKWAAALPEDDPRRADVAGECAAAMGKLTT